MARLWTSFTSTTRAGISCQAASTPPRLRFARRWTPRRLYAGFCCRGVKNTGGIIVRYETGKPRTAEVVKGLTDYMVDDPSIIAFKMASVKAGYTFEVTWYYK